MVRTSCLSAAGRMSSVSSSPSGCSALKEQLGGRSCSRHSTTISSFSWIDMVESGPTRLDATLVGCYIFPRGFMPVTIREAGEVVFICFFASAEWLSVNRFYIRGRDGITAIEMRSCTHKTAANEARTATARSSMRSRASGVPSQCYLESGMSFESGGSRESKVSLY